MFKKIEIWILYLVLLLSILFATSVGFLVRQDLVGGARFGALTEAAMLLAESPSVVRSTLMDGDALQLVDRTGTVAGFAGRPMDREMYLLLSRFDGDMRESVVELIDLRSFDVLHTWNPDYNVMFNSVDRSTLEFESLLKDDHDNRAEIRHPVLLADGGLVIHAETSPLLKIDKCSEAIWINSKERFHHSVELDHNGEIWAPVSAYPYLVDSAIIAPDTPDFLDDSITRVNGAGEILFQRSVASILINNGYREQVFPYRPGTRFPHPDPIHLNDIQPVLTDSDYWQKGDLFLSIRNLSMIVLYRPSTDKILWTGSGAFSNQHDIDILGDGRISIFDNNRKMSAEGATIDGVNRVIVYDFATDAYSSYLEDAMAAHNIATPTQGLSEIIDDGSMFVVDSNAGRALMFESDGAMRWQHVNRAEDGNVYYVGWHRILHSTADIENVQNFLSMPACRIPGL